ncbi:hypothetical protein TNIN_89701 [Trichonephila inaurata madagascariensis]|uniref:Uncharacterized protein n=1 Tax=Trichonephila inaurata madagascariensis TaxID=2747483 RepID=A0A8X7BRS5_9ARAC|nr:hypothetical protein TNIN_89701 [Trichonephila inaurata madagascariensis]
MNRKRSRILYDDEKTGKCASTKLQKMNSIKKQLDKEHTVIKEFLNTFEEMVFNLRVEELFLRSMHHQHLARQGYKELKEEEAKNTAVMPEQEGTSSNTLANVHSETILEPLFLDPGSVQHCFISLGFSLIGQSSVTICLHGIG